MLNKDLFFTKIEELIGFYPTWKVDVGSEKVMKQWYEKFKKLTDKQFEHMIDSYINTEEYSPTVAGLLKHDTLPRKSQTQIAHERMLKEQEELLELERASKC